METIAEFNDDKGFNVKLTKDKIFITVIGNEETFALRGVNGVGLYDDLEKYNEELEIHKKTDNKLSGQIMIGIGVVLVVVSFFTKDALPIFLVEGIILAGAGYFTMNLVNEPPKLDSYFKLILSGNDRRFKFDKNDETSSSIADFINKIEETLTAYK